MAAGNHVTSVLNQFSRLVCPLLRLWRYEVRTYVYWNVLMCISHLLRKMRWSFTSAAVTAAATLAWLPSSTLSGDAPGSALEGKFFVNSL